MLNLDTPNVTNFAEPEQNIQALKSWAEYLIGQLNYEFQTLEDEISQLQSELSTLKEEEQ